MHFVYILFSTKLNRFYIGQTNNLEERIIQHNTSFNAGSFTSKANDWQLFTSLTCTNRLQAQQLERFIKKMRNRSFYTRLRDDENLRKDFLKRFD